MPHILQATGSAGAARPLRFTGCRRVVQGREPMIHGLAVVRVAATSCVLQGVGAWRGADTPFLQGLDSSGPSGPLRFTTWRCLAQGRPSTIHRPAVALAAAGPYFLQGGVNLCMADPGADPGRNPMFYKSQVHEVHFPELAPEADPAGEPIFAGYGRPCVHCSSRIHAGSTTPATFLASDPCGSMWRIHVDFPFLYVEKCSATALIKILIKAAADPDPGAIGARRRPSF